MPETDHEEIIQENVAGRKILVLFAHPSIDRSEVNRPLAEATKGVEGVTFVDLYALYPRLDIDVDREQKRLLENDVIIFMHPLYWYSTPAILKEWQDLVLEHGFAYGSGGNALRGKIFFCATTAGGSEPAYAEQGYQHFTLRQLLQPLEQMAFLCGMIYLPPFSLFSSRDAFEENRIRHHVSDWRRLLQSLKEGTFDIESAAGLEKLNANLDELIAGKHHE